MNTYAKLLIRLQPSGRQLLQQQQHEQIASSLPTVFSSVRKASSGTTLEYDTPKAYKLHMLEKGPSTHVSCNREEDESSSPLYHSRNSPLPSPSYIHLNSSECLNTAFVSAVVCGTPLYPALR
ncbi:unnamed protein product [Adineta steineri]|uniref:Uncharacterized protein n=1 Tax=Adineta steineri TaxID=433720 RepID=A0A813VXQ6_9BILA|nr:unnamed protein product [Adineta steineri]